MWEIYKLLVIDEYCLFIFGRLNPFWGIIWLPSISGWEAGSRLISSWKAEQRAKAKPSLNNKFRFQQVGKSKFAF